MADTDVVVLNETLSRLEVPPVTSVYNMPRSLVLTGNITASGNFSGVNFTGSGAASFGSLTVGGVQLGAVDAGTATSVGALAINDTGKVWATNVFQTGTYVTYLSGGIPAVADVDSNTATGLVLAAGSPAPDAGTTYSLYGNGAPTLEQTLVNGDLGAIAATLVKNAVAYFVYDTSKDSDGGAWRKRCTHTSWYNETLNTADRGATREFPAKSLTIITASTATIYDLTDPNVPMWKVLPVDGQTGLSSVAARDGWIIVGNAQNTARSAFFFSFIADGVETIDGASALAVSHRFKSELSYATAYQSGSIGLAPTATLAGGSRVVNKVAITVLDDAPIDSATGLPKLTIRAMTAAGGSEITDDATSVVWDATGAINLVSGDVNKDGYTAYAATDKVYIFNAPLAADTALTSADYILDTAGVIEPHISGTIAKVKWAGNKLLIASSTGLFTLTYNPATPAASLLAKTDNAFSSGHLVGANRGAWLANSVTADRSVHANPLTENGTVPVTPVTNGVNQYGPYTAANNLTAASNAEWDVITTGPFYQVGWFKSSGNVAIESYSGFANAGNTIRNLVTMAADGTLNCIDDGATASVATASTEPYDDGRWHQFIFVRTSSTARTLYIDGKSVATNTTDAGSLTGTGTLPFAIGVDPDGSTTPATTTSLALVRIGATDITAEQAEYMYETEKPLFASGALALLSAAAVTDLDYNADAEILKVETAAANDFLHGLKVAARGAALTDTTDRGFDYVTVNGTTDIRPSMTARTLRAQLADKSEELAKALQGDIEHYFTLGAGLASYRFTAHAGMKPIAVFDLTTGTFIDMDTNPATRDCFIWQANGLTATNKYKVTLRRV